MIWRKRVVFGLWMGLSALAWVIMIRFYDGQAARPSQAGLPYGVYLPEAYPGMISTRDFFSHQNMLRAQWTGEVARPYTVEGQQEVIQAWVPRLQSGLIYGYFPVALVVGAPLAVLPARSALIAWAALNLAAAAALGGWFLLPRAGTPAQLLVLLAALTSYSYFSMIFAGQTAVLTTACLAVLIALVLDPATGRFRRLGRGGEVLAAAVVWALCAKPNLATVGMAILLAAGAWRPVLAGGVAALLTALAVSPWVGGFPQWMADYSQLLAHYHRAGVGEFLAYSTRPALLTGLQSTLDYLGWAGPATALEVSKILWLGGAAGLVILARRGSLPPAETVALLVGWFLTVGPNVTEIEDWALCLAVVTTGFFGRRELLLPLVVLVMVALNWRVEMAPDLALPPLAFAAKLAIWLLAAAAWCVYRPPSRIRI